MKMKAVRVGPWKNKKLGQQEVILDLDLVCFVWPFNLTFAPPPQIQVTSTWAPQTPVNVNTCGLGPQLNKEQCQEHHGLMVGSGCETPHYVADVFFFSCLLFLGTFVLSMSLKNFRNARFFPNRVSAALKSFEKKKEEILGCQVCKYMCVGCSTYSLRGVLMTCRWGRW